MIDKHLAHYSIAAKIGAGGMGEVYRAADTKLGRDVALKVLPEEWAATPDRLSRFKREAKMVAALSHPNIVTLFSVEEADGVHFLTMELVEGKGLDALLPSEGFELERFLDLATPMVDAVASAHARGIVHRDLKPGNVMVTDEGGRVKVLDFGLAKPSGASAGAGSSQVETLTRTQEGMVVGTPHYMSPEQARGESIDHRSDIFSLGVVLYEMATGEKPFRGRSSIELLSSVLRDQPKPVSEVQPELPRHLGRVIGRCLEKAPHDRYQTARDLYNELRALSRETASGSLPDPTPAPAECDPAPSAEPDVPWIAVRSLLCHGGDPEIESLADGLTEEITNGLSRFPYLLVVSHSSARALDGKAMDLREVAVELGARYMMEGTLRRAGSRVRIAVNLVDAQTGTHLWTETYDRDLEALGVFELQDDITDRVVATVADPNGALTRSLALATASKAPESLTPHEAVLRSFLYRQRVSAEEHLQARIALERAAESEPDNAEVLAALADIYLQEVNKDFNPRADSLDRALRAARRAVESDPASQFAHCALAKAHFHNNDITSFRACAERALQLNRRSSDTMALLGLVFSWTGDWSRGVELTARARELNPHHPGWYHLADFFDYYRKRHWAEALEIAQQMNAPDFWMDPLARTLANAELGNDGAASGAAKDLLRVWPDFEARFQRVGLDAWFYAVPELADQMVRGLAKAGLEVVIVDETQAGAPPVQGKSSFRSHGR